jgi:hypothetical protein
MIDVAATREDDVGNDIRKMEIVNWKKVAQDRDRRKTEARKMLVLPG